MTKSRILTGFLLFATLSGIQAQTYLDLQPLFDADVVLESGGAGEGNALDAEGRRIDATSLPASYQDGAPVKTQDGRAQFKFATLKQASRDALIMGGQVIDVPDAAYESLDVAMLSAPGAFANPFSQIELRYADGSKENRRWGPVAGWFNSPTAFDNTFFRFTDDSQVTNLVSFRTDFGAAESQYLLQERGNGNSGGNRFVDGNGYVLYLINNLADLRQARLGVTVGNNFVISLAAEYHDPDFSTTDGFTVVANSMQIYNGYEHRSLGNLKQYEFDVSSYLAQGAGELYILLTDATPANGWGPYLQQMSLFTGAPNTFEGVLQPVVDTSNAAVYAMFRTGDSTNETPYLYDNSGSGPSNRGHRFADGNGSITYRFDLPDDVTNANLTVDMANNFVVSLAGSSDLVRYYNVNAATPEEKNVLMDEGGSQTGGDFRFADGNAYMVYQFDLPDEVTNAFAQVHIGNEFVMAAAAGTNGEFKIAKDWVAETGVETHDLSNLDYYVIDLAPFLTNNPAKIVQLRFTDGVPADGWGPYLMGIAIVNKKDAGQVPFKMVLNSQDRYGEDIRNEYNKKPYTIDLSTMLTNNPKKEVFVKFTDGSTADGWGPGIFWMAVYSGELNIQSDQWVFDNLKTTLGDPAGYGLGLLHRRYAVNAQKQLAAIALASQPATETSKVYVLAATLNAPSQPLLLKVARAAGQKARISWAATQSGFQLQTTAALNAPIQWSNVPGSPSVETNEWVLEVSADQTARYFRLAK